MTAKCAIDFPIPLPDDPKKWDGWTRYKSSNLYERLCLDAGAHPSNELIEEHCRELLRWWQKKLPLKNQPSNPLSQLLRPGIEESSRYLTEARVELLDPKRRAVMDEELAAQALEEATAEFHKFLTFAIAGGKLTEDEESNLLQFGLEHGLTQEQMVGYIDAELKDSGAVRVQPPPEGADDPAKRNPREEFNRMLRLSGLDSISMTDDQRDALINMAENLGLEPADAEDMVDDYLNELDGVATPPAPAPPPKKIEVVKAAAPAQPNGASAPEPAKIDIHRSPPLKFHSLIGADMVLVRGGEFSMGSEAMDAAPNERPITRVTLSPYYLSRYPITNTQYEQFDPSHARRRAPGTGPTHPVVYVSHVEAVKFCQWLSAREHRKYRLPTEAEWEFAARANDGRKYPWGNYDRRGDLANFADKNTVFAWSDREIDDGYAETSPVGAFPRGTSPFGIEDMAGNIWEWCLDYYEAYKGSPRVNPRGATTGQKRVYRGGSWKSRFSSLRTTTRGSNVPGYSCNDLGFRIACECE